MPTDGSTRAPAAQPESAAKKYRSQIADLVQGFGLGPLQRGELALAVAGLLDDALAAQPIQQHSGNPASNVLNLAETLREREHFEAQMRAEGVTDFTRRPSGRYDNMVLEWHWLGWRGRARAGEPS